VATKSMNADTEHDHVFRLIMGAWASQAVRTIAALSVAEHLQSGRLTAGEIAERESCDPAMTYRVLRAGVALGLLVYEPATETFSGTSLLSVLHEDSPVTLKHYAQAAIGPAFRKTALLLPETVREGRNQAVAALGSDVFTHLSNNQAEARLFRTAMTEISGPVVQQAVSNIAVEDSRTVVDVGGAEGAFVCELVRQHPEISGIVLELPQAMPGIRAEAERHEISDRISGVPGDFFTSVPAGDIYLLKFILHDWDDESCVRILSSVRRAMNPGARIFIVDMAMTPYAPSVDAALMDLAMLFATTGQERELPQFEVLLSAAGLRRTRIVALQPPYYLIEAHAG
jgi:hypothetical protein